MSKRRETALQAIQALNDWDIEAIMAYRHEDCIHEMLPKSLGQPPADNTTFRKHFSALMSLLKNYKAEVDDIVEDAADNKVAVHVQGSADSDFGPYRNEFIMVFYFTEDGSKVVRVREFVDSLYTTKFFAPLKDGAKSTEA